MRKGSVSITHAAVPAKFIVTRASILALMQFAARVGAGEIGDEEISDVSFGKIISGTLTGTKVLTFSGAEVVAKSANFQAGLQRFTAPLISNLSANVHVPGAKFTAADIGGRVQGRLIPAGATILAKVSDDDITLSAPPLAPALDVALYFPDRTAGTGWAFYGDGTMEINLGGIFRGKIELAGFSVAEDGTVTIGAGDSQMTANPDGSFTWGKDGAIIGITPDGKLFAGGTDEATAIFLVDQAGNVTVRQTSQSTHSIPLSALNTSILPPTFDPPGGAFATAVDVAILDQEPNVAIYYTTDGSTPDDSDTLYTGARIHLTGTTTVKAIAYIGPFKSAVSSQTFTSDAAVVPNPTADPVAGDYSPLGGTLDVDIACSLAGASMRYTTDGSTPSDVTGTLVSPPNGATIPSATVHLTAGTRTLKVIAFKSGKTNSGVVTNVYVITSGGSGTGGGTGGGRGNTP